MRDKGIKVLLIEDNPGDARLIRELLSESTSHQFVFEHIDRLTKGLERLSKGNVDVVLLDLHLPDSQGIATFETAYKHAQNVPIVVLTGLSDAEVAVKAVHNGAQDYLVKGQVDSNLLVRAILYAIERKQIDRMKSDFISVASHELRSPLAAMKNALLALENRIYGELTDEQLHMVEIARRNADRLINLTNNLLDLSRIEAGKLSPNIISLDIKELIRTLLLSVKLQADKKSISLVQQIPANLPKVMGDSMMLERVFINLVDNAIKFTPEKGEVRVSAELFAESCGGGAIPNDDEVRNWFQTHKDYVKVSVQDSGIGISPDKLASIFDKFYQVSVKSARDRGKGVGLGLAIVKELMRAQDGCIWVESEVGKGSIFSFCLPVESACPDAKGIGA